MTTFEKETLKTLLLMFEHEVSAKTINTLNPLSEDAIENLKCEATDIRITVSYLK